MPIKLEIFGDTIEAFASELDALAKFIRPAGLPDEAAAASSVLDGLSLGVLREAIVNRFDQEGYEVRIKVRDEPATAVEAETMVKPAEPEPAPAPAKRRGRPRLDPETAKARLQSGNGSKPKLSVVEPEEEDDPFNSSQPDDKTFVVDKLKTLYDGDTDLRPRITAFMTKMAKAYGGDKMPNLPADKFAEIRKQMEAEFDG